MTSLEPLSIKSTRSLLLTLLAALALICMFASQSWAMARKPPLHEKAPVSAKQSSESKFTLRNCYDLALKQSETIAIRAEAVEATEAQFFKAASEALGDVNFKMTQFRQDARDGGDSASVTGTLASQLRRERKFVISQPLFQGFKALAALNAAGGLRDQRTQERIRAEQLLFKEVAETFYGVLRYQKDVETIESILKLFEERIADLTERERIGRSRKSELVTAEARSKSLEADLARSRGQLATLRHNLEFLTGVSIDIAKLDDEEVPQELVAGMDIYLEMVKKRADVEAARQAEHIAKQGIVSAQSELWPDITLDSNVWQKREGFQSGIDWDLLFTIDIPLFQGGEAVGNLKESISTWKKMKLSHELIEREAALDIKESFERWVASLARYRALEEAQSASEENFKLQKEEYARNLVSNLDVLEALEFLNETRRQANDAHYEMKENYWGLKVAAGETL